MKVYIITSCLAILIVFASYRNLHAIKISTSEVTLAKGIIKIKLKLFSDDLALPMAQLIKKNVPFDGTEVDAYTLGFLNTYIKSNFSLSINNEVVNYTFKSSLIDNNLSTEIKTIWLEYEGAYKISQPIKIIELKNTLLFDAIPEQKNISKFILENSESQTLTFENQNNDVKKQIQY